MQLAGVQHITISAPLLQQLSETTVDTWNSNNVSIFESNGNKIYAETDFQDIVEDESAWRLAFAKSGFGASHGKIIQAINYFSDFQERLENIAATYI